MTAEAAALDDASHMDLSKWKRAVSAGSLVAVVLFALAALHVACERLALPGKVRGRVAEVALDTVHLVGPPGVVGDSAWSERDGAYRFANVVPGAYALAARASTGPSEVTVALGPSVEVGLLGARADIPPPDRRREFTVGLRPTLASVAVAPHELGDVWSVEWHFEVRLGDASTTLEPWHFDFETRAPHCTLRGLDGSRVLRIGAVARLERAGRHFDSHPGWSDGHRFAVMHVHDAGVSESELHLDLTPVAEVELEVVFADDAPEYLAVFGQLDGVFDHLGGSRAHGWFVHLNHQHRSVIEFALTEGRWEFGLGSLWRGVSGPRSLDDALTDALLSSCYGRTTIDVAPPAAARARIEVRRGSVVVVTPRHSERALLDHWIETPALLRLDAGERMHRPHVARTHDGRAVISSIVPGERYRLDALALEFTAPPPGAVAHVP